MKRVFISYSRRDKKFAELLARDLDDAGLEVWIDFRQITGGELWQNEIYRGIERSEFIIFCMSPASVVSEWCNREIMAGREQGKLIIPIMVVDAYEDLKKREHLSWILDVHFLDFTKNYEIMFPQLLDALPGARPVGVYDTFDPSAVPNPFKGLEAFQQTDSHFFFGREQMILRSLKRMQETHFLAFVGASGSGKSSLVRAGILPQVRNGNIPNSDTWRTAIFMPGNKPLEALATRIIPMLPEDDTRTVDRVVNSLHQPQRIDEYVNLVLEGQPPQSRLLIVIDQFEEVFTRASEVEAQAFIDVLVSAARSKSSRIQILLTMRADFFGGLSRYPDLAKLFEQENMIIVTEMTAADLRRAIEGPVQAVGLKYEDGLVERILEDVRSQPGSLPLLQYALRQLFDRRQGAVLTNAAYDEIGGVRRALAQHAEEIFSTFTQQQQEITRRILLRLVEVSEAGEATRRKVTRDEVHFADVDDAIEDEVIDLLTAADARLLIASRQISSTSDEDETGEPIITLEVSHEALIREWERFKSWVSASLEDLQYRTELRKSAHDWDASGRDRAYLLIGKRLTRAEVWLETADANMLQREFIGASLDARAEREQQERERQERELMLERQNTSRLRLLSILLVIGFVASIIASVISISQRNELETLTGQLSESNDQLSERQNELEEQSLVLARTAAESQSLALSAEAERAFVDRDTDLALALALNASDIQNPPLRVQSSLNDIALAAGTRLIIETPNLTVESIAYNPDASQIATGLGNGEIIIWDVARGRRLMRWQAHDLTVTAIDFSPDGTRLVSASAGQSDNLKIWDPATGQELQNLVHHTDRVNTVMYTPDGQFVISGSDDRTYAAWNVAVWGAGFVGQREQAIQQIDISSSINQWIVAVADTSSIAILDRSWGLTREIIPRNNGFSDDITSIRLNPNATELMVGFRNGNIGIWGIQSGTLRQSFSALEAAVAVVEFLPRDSKVIAGLADGTLRIWDEITGLQTDVFNVEAPVKDIALNRKRVRLVVSQEGSMRIWDIQGSAEIQRLLAHDGQVATVAYHPDGERAISGSFDNSLILWNLTDGSIIRQFTGHANSILSVAFNADGTRFVSGSSDKSVRIWNTDQEVALLTLTGHTGNVTSVAYSPDGTKVASGGFDKLIKVWDSSTGGLLSTLEGHDGSIASLTFSPDGTQLLSTSFDNSLILWDVATFTQIRQFVGHTSSVFTGGFSADGSKIVSGSVDKTIRLWDSASGREIRRMEGHDRVVNTVVFVPDTNTVLSASADGTLRLWDGDTGSEIYRYTVQNSFGRAIAMRALAISKDGLRAITGMADFTVRQWEILPTMDRLIRWTLDNRHVRDLTCNERILFGLQELADSSQQVFINSTTLTVPLLLDPSEGAVIADAANGETVRILAGPVTANDNTFFEICTASGVEGWANANVLDGLSSE